MNSILIPNSFDTIILSPSILLKPFMSMVWDKFYTLLLYSLCLVFIFN
jgi:hypothetical protein